MPDGQNFKLWLGIVVEDRSLGSRLVKCYLKELLPTMNGGLGDSTKDEEYELEDVLNEGTINGSVKTTNCITAEWLGITNRAFPPDVVKGEQVMVLRYADSDIFYWESLGRDDNLRRGELHRISISDDMRVVKDLDDDNTYFIELDTRTAKRIRIKTSDSDGENYRYEFMINAGEDYATLNDNIGNRIELHSAIPNIILHNSEGTWTELNKKDINSYAPQHIMMRAVDKIQLNATTINLYASDTVHATATDVKVEATGIDLKASASIDMEAPAVTITSAATKVDGPLAVTGAFTSMGPSTLGGVSVGSGGKPADMEIIGNLHIDGNISFTGSISGPGGSWHNP